MIRIESVIEGALLILKVDRERKPGRGGEGRGTCRGGMPGRGMTGKIENRYLDVR